jgi:tRNA (adenine37-N6)-methyltransferase
MIFAIWEYSSPLLWERSSRNTFGGRKHVYFCCLCKHRTMSKCNVILVGITAVALAVSVVSWRKQVNAKKELIALQKQQQRRQKSKFKDFGGEETSVGKAAKTTMNGTLLKDGFSVYPIGTIRSVYQLCVGTPRQGLLAPSARGCIHLHKLGDSSTEEAVSGLGGFAYVWILFVFHLNTQSSSKSRRFKSKISPPALGGLKVGVYATRSPHRPNPIGITLCKLDRIQVDCPHQVTLYISGLDLVDGTPVLDIKPYVPVYDSVSPVREKLAPDVLMTQFYTPPHVTRTSAAAQVMSVGLPPPSVPEWVDGGLKTFRQVVFTEGTKQELKRILESNPRALQFYGPEYGEDLDTTFVAVLQCITQVLAMDIRSSYQTDKSRKGKFQVERAKRLESRLENRDKPSTNTDTHQQRPQEQLLCTQQLDNLIITYKVESNDQPHRSMSNNSGAEDLIVVKSVELLRNR